MKKVSYISGSGKGREDELVVYIHRKAGRNRILSTKFAALQHLCRSRVDPVQKPVQIYKQSW